MLTQFVTEGLVEAGGQQFEQLFDHGQEDRGEILELLLKTDEVGPQDLLQKVIVPHHFLSGLLKLSQFFKAFGGRPSDVLLYSEHHVEEVEDDLLPQTEDLIVGGPGPLLDHFFDEFVEDRDQQERL